VTGVSRVAVLGDALVDEMRSDSGEVTEAPGGSALNVAVGIAILGAPVSLTAMIGDDEAGRGLIAHTSSHGLGVLASAAPLGTGRAISDRTAGEPRYSFSRASVERSIEFSARIRAELDAAAFVVVSGFPFDNTPQVDALLDAVVSPRTRLLVDPNPREGLITDLGLFVGNLDRVVAQALLVKIGDDDADLLYGMPLEDVAARFIGLGAATVLATAGAAGATLHFAGGTVSRPIVDIPGPIVDTLGAGDSTFAVVAAALASDTPPRDRDGWARVLERAMAVAAATVRQPGGLLRLPPG